MRHDSQSRDPIVFVINSLEGGGAERAITNILAGLEAHAGSREIHIVLLDDLPEVQVLPAYVTKHVLGAGGSLWRSVSLLTKKLRVLHPALTVSFLTRANCASVLAAKLLGHKSIISERVHTTNHFGHALSALPKKLQVRLLYRFADRIVAVSEGVRRDLIENFGQEPARISVIHNPFAIATLQAKAQGPSGQAEPYIVSVGRLVPNKNFAMLIDAYSQAKISEKLVIVGEGPERENLQTLAQRLNVAARVEFAGYLANPYPVVAGARYFVSSSNAEGFPNAIVEAMSLERPVIATDCQAGPGDILSPDVSPAHDKITMGAFGILVPVNRADLLGNAMRQMSDTAVAARYGALGVKRAASFDAASICRQYWEEIHALL